ncbi:hypothetical protein CAPTEDRAFT_169216 [Capitella teleta]|uniref:Ectonucleoside triphosphate diphosphohydrolase 7 n=1 Tax=Capitella teleta TaxID=283909 RepID=R7VDJ0_CAPTE|nr:hypothetical protein CAPTEDRAFT_169216 [Capitella teleta]|eukprot:ELU13735.1 hypothetical protein CAPTEDRAFT_169216 [Capitella teleta]
MATTDFSAAVATDTKNPLLNYGLVIDCGSSGSRIFVYFWPTHEGHSNELLHIQPFRDELAKPVVKKIEPGIATFADRPSEASAYIRPLLEYAAQHVPREKHRETPLYIMATAGMRLISPRDQEAILNDLRSDIPLEFNFIFPETQAEVIPGKQEGVYAWIATNYALGKFDHSLGDDPLTVVDLPGTEGKTHIRKRTVGIMDMGGASLQIAFEVPKSVRFDLPKEDVAKSMLAEFNLGCSRQDLDHQYRVYVSTFLGMGGNSMRWTYELHLIMNATLTAHNSNSSAIRTGLTPDLAIIDPCLNPDMNDTVIVEDVTYHLVGSGDFWLCQQLLLPLMNKSAPCVKQPCSLNGVFQPQIAPKNTEFYGFAEFFYTMEDLLHIGGNYDQIKFHKAAKDFCSTRWSLVSEWKEKGLNPRADSNRYRLQCFKSAWLSSILHQGLNLPKNYQHFTSMQYIDGQEIHWTLGALLYKTRYFPLREIEKHTSRHYRPPWAIDPGAPSLLIICIFVVAVAILIYLRRLRIVPSSRSGLPRVPTMKYFMTDADQEQDGLLFDRHGAAFPHANMV